LPCAGKLPAVKVSGQPAEKAAGNAIGAPAGAASNGRGPPHAVENGGMAEQDGDATQTGDCHAVTVDGFKFHILPF
jgi:hypothetical protein